MNNLFERQLSDKHISIIAIISCLSLYILVYQNLYWTLGIPFALFIIFIILNKPDSLWYLVPFIMPFSINPNDVDLGKLSISLPCEPMLILLVAFFILLLLFQPQKIDRRIFAHPVAICFYIYMLWILITAFASVDKVVSLKFFVAKIWLIVPMFFLSSIFFTEIKNIKRFIWYLLIGLSCVAIYNIVHLSMYGFADRPSQATMQPFFKDHAVFSSVLAMTIPPVWVLIGQTSNATRKIAAIILFIIISFCLIITYSRGAYVSLVPAILFPLFIKLGLRFKGFLLILISFVAFLSFNFNDVVFALESNKPAASGQEGSNIESISNITTDESNLERINRWASAIEMWKVKPHMGWGPGTYMFEYAPFQYSYNYTSISTNHGDVGNAHSEYLGTLAEMGWPGLLIFLILILVILRTAFQNIEVLTDSVDRAWNMAAICGLISYFTHAFLNNFLDTDKTSVVFWALVSILVSLQLKQNKQSNISLV